MRRAGMAALVIAAALLAPWGGAAAHAQTNTLYCTREELKQLIDRYIDALEGHDLSSLELEPSVRFTENGVEMPLGKGFWTTAGKVLLKRSALDTKTCETATELVVEEKGRPILLGVRLRLDEERIWDIEHIVAREEEFGFNPKGVLETANQDWEGILKPDERSSREAMIAAAVNYFDMFSKAPKATTAFAQPCNSRENGTETTKGITFQGKDYPPHDCSPEGLVINQPPRRVPVVDVEAGIVVAFIHFAGNFPDLHMFKMRNGKVQLIQAVIGPKAPSTGWEEGLTSKK